MGQQSICCLNKTYPCIEIWLVFKNLSFLQKFQHLSSHPRRLYISVSAFHWRTTFLQSWYTEPVIFHKIAHLPELQIFFKHCLKIGEEDLKFQASRWATATGLDCDKDPRLGKSEPPTNSLMCRIKHTGCIFLLIYWPSALEAIILRESLQSFLVWLPCSSPSARNECAAFTTCFPIKRSLKLLTRCIKSHPQPLPSHIYSAQTPNTGMKNTTSNTFLFLTNIFFYCHSSTVVSISPHHSPTPTLVPIPFGFVHESFILFLDGPPPIFSH